MTDTGTPIEPQDIQVGDRVLRDAQIGDDILTAEFTVRDIDNHLLFSGSSRYDMTGDWFLISRPTPPREPGTLWEDIETESCYVRTARPLNTSNWHYIKYFGAGEPFLNELVPEDAETIARLTPVEPPEVAEMRRTLAAGIRAFIPDTCTTITGDAWCDRCGPYRRVLAIVEPQP